MKKLYIGKSKINGKGVYVENSINSGDFITHIKGPKILIKKFNDKLSKATVNWIGASKHTWIDTDQSIFRFINHSCDPNCAIKGERTVFAVKDISKNSELTIDYSLNETELEWSILSCTCGSKNCRKLITPIYYLPKRVFLEKKNFIPKKFQELYLKHYAHYHK